MPLLPIESRVGEIATEIMVRAILLPKAAVEEK